MDTDGDPLAAVGSIRQTKQGRLTGSECGIHAKGASIIETKQGRLTGVGCGIPAVVGASTRKESSTVDDGSCKEPLGDVTNHAYTRLDDITTLRFYNGEGKEGDGLSEAAAGEECSMDGPAAAAADAAAADDVDIYEDLDP